MACRRQKASAVIVNAPNSFVLSKRPGINCRSWVDLKDQKRFLKCLSKMDLQKMEDPQKDR